MTWGVYNEEWLTTLALAMAVTPALASQFDDDMPKCDAGPTSEYKSCVDAAYGKRDAPRAAAPLAVPKDYKREVKRMVETCRALNFLGVDIAPNSLDPGECVGQSFAQRIQEKGHTLKGIDQTDKAELLALSQAVESTGPKIGQSKAEVEDGLWGKPRSVNRPLRPPVSVSNGCMGPVITFTLRMAC